MKTRAVVSPSFVFTEQKTFLNLPRRQSAGVSRDGYEMIQSLFSLPNSSEFVQGYPHSRLFSLERMGSPFRSFASFQIPFEMRKRLSKNWLPTSLPRNERSPSLNAQENPRIWGHVALQYDRPNRRCLVRTVVPYCTVGGCSLPNKTHGRLGISYPQGPKGRQPAIASLTACACAKLVTFHEIGFCLAATPFSKCPRISARVRNRVGVSRVALGSISLDLPLFVFPACRCSGPSARVRHRFWTRRLPRVGFEIYAGRGSKSDDL